jgi:cell division protein FtsB
MGLFKKKPDPISDRARDLNAELAALEAEIKRLNTQRDQLEHQPRLRSAAFRGGPAASRGSLPETPQQNGEPIFEEVNQDRVKAAPEPTSQAHYNELGVRKYDLAASWRRWLGNFRGPTAANPKLINYLAAGSIQGLRPLRYEKRVARNRFIFLFLVLLVLLLGLVSVFLRHR